MLVGRRAFGVAVAVVLAGAGCSHSGKAAVGSTSSTTSAVAAKASVYASARNFTVGVVTLRLPSGNRVEVWYPANGAVGVGSDSYDVRDFLPPSVASRVGAKAYANVRNDANRDAPVGAPGEVFPLVLFSHGDAGFRDEATFLSTWLASWGFVVAAPDHPSRDLAAALAPPAAGTQDDVTDLLATVDLIQRENARVGPFKDRVDLSKIAVVGLDSGGRAAMRLAADRRIAGYVSIASDNPPAGSAAATIPEPHKPSLFLAGASDRVVPPSATAAAFKSAPAPSYQWVIDGAGHNAFDDLCLAAKPQGGLIAMVDQSGIGALFPTALRTTLTDGCAPPDLEATKAWPIIDQAVTAFLRHVVGPDRVAVDLGPAGARAIDGVKVTVSQQPG